MKKNIIDKCLRIIELTKNEVSQPQANFRKIIVNLNYLRDIFKIEKASNKKRTINSIFGRNEKL